MRFPYKDRLALSIILLVVIVSCFSLFKNIRNINLHWDWLQMFSYYHADRQALLQFHQLPLRTYYFGGGYPLIANPQDGALNPFFLPVLIFGEVIGLKINVFLAHIIAALGMYYLTRRVLKYNLMGSAFSTLVFCLGGHMHRLLIRGQDYISSFYAFFIPLAVALFLKARENKIYAYYCAFVMALIVSQAGLYALPAVFLIFLLSCLELVKYRDNHLVCDTSYIRNFFKIMLIVSFLAAVKILPMIELLRQDMHYMEGYVSYWKPSLANLYSGFLQHRTFFPDTELHWQYFYLGYFPLILCVFSFLFFWKESKRYFILLAIFALLAFGAHTRLDLFGLLWRLPLFHSIGAPTRYFSAPVIFLIAVISGRAFLIQERMKLRITVAMLGLVLIFTATDLMMTNGSYGDSFPEPVPQYAKQASFFQVKNTGPQQKPKVLLVPERMFWLSSWEGLRPTQYELMLQNIGKINWYGNIHSGEYTVPKYFIDWDKVDSFAPRHFKFNTNPDYRGEIYFLNSINNKATFEYFSPNEIIVKVEVSEPDMLIINQNYDKHWKSALKNTINYNGLLAFRVDKKGDYAIKFNYMPVGFYTGLSVSLITAFFIIFHLLRQGYVL